MLIERMMLHLYSKIMINLPRPFFKARVGRDKEAMDGNARLNKPNFSDIKLTLIYFSHPCALDSGQPWLCSPCRNDDYMICVDSYGL